MLNIYKLRTQSWLNCFTYLGVLPFILCACLHFLHPDMLIGHQSITHYESTYTFMIGSFMAGTIWGHAAGQPLVKPHWGLFLSVTWGLLIWFLYLFSSEQYFIKCMPVMFIMLLFTDYYLHKLGLVNLPYLKMRIIITTIVVLSLILFSSVISTIP